jgi:hypothetical protein
MEQDLNALVTRLREALGDNLRSLVLYGSAVAGEFHSKHSDLNVLSLVERLDGSVLERINPASTWWTRKGHPAPLVFTLEELQRSADVFAIELLDIKTSRRVLFGRDLVADLNIPMNLHHLQVERELRNNLVRLRQHYLSARRDDKTTLGLMTASVSSFISLFRHALVALGEQPAADPHQPKHVVVDRLAALLSFDPSGFHTVLEIREEKKSTRQADVPATFRAYLDAVAKVVHEVDERLSPSNQRRIGTSPG